VLAAGSALAVPVSGEGRTLARSPVDHVARGFPFGGSLPLLAGQLRLASPAQLPEGRRRQADVGGIVKSKSTLARTFCIGVWSRRPEWVLADGVATRRAHCIREEAERRVLPRERAWDEDENNDAGKCSIDHLLRSISNNTIKATVG